MEIDPIEMMTFCVAVLDQLSTLGQPAAGLDEEAVAAASAQMTEGLGVLVEDEAVASEGIAAMRQMIGDMPADDMAEAAEFCLDMAQAN